jgi:magnesium-transporting ATPase (P-type)
MLSLVFVLIGRAYPLIPFQLSIYGLLFEAMPAFILTFRENDTPIQDRILQRAIKRAFPFALGITFFTTILQIAGQARGYLAADLSWMSFGVTAIFGALLVGDVYKPQKADKRLPTVACSGRN